MRKNSKEKLKRTLKCLLMGIIFAIGAVMVFVNSGIGHSYIVRSNAEKASRNLTAKQAKKNAKKSTSYDVAKTKPVTAKTLFDASHYPALPIGRMSIPAVNIHNPVFKGFGTQGQNLSYGVCTVLPDRTLGSENNYVLAGHYMGNYGPAILDNLHLAKTGDVVYVTDMTQIYAYRIEELTLALDPHQVSVEDNIPGQSNITLITCSDFDVVKYGYGKHRTVAQGTLFAKYPATKANLIKYELANRNVSNNQPQPQHKTTVSRIKNSPLQRCTLSQIIKIFAIIWVVSMIMLITIIWIG
ncbi:class A sortase [Limosilactobacillus allomucosae]|uniref:class A sortase n=1 Tax=Limosilactobacillus allomucosae TaxID=3142938 RepID=UPI003267900F